MKNIAQSQRAGTKNFHQHRILIKKGTNDHAGGQ